MIMISNISTIIAQLKDLSTWYMWVYVVCAFFLIRGYFIIQVVIFPPLPFPNCVLFISFTSLKPLEKKSVKCNPEPIITLHTPLTPPCSMLLLKHNKGVECTN